METLDIRVKIFIILALVVIAYIIYRKNFKPINMPSVALVTGGVKTGKSLTCVKLSQKEYKKTYFNYLIVSKIFRKKIEKPLYYTNVFITFGDSRRKHYIKSEKLKDFKYPYALYEDEKGYYYFSKLDNNIRRVTLDSLARKERFNYKSIVYIQEASLMADNMDFKNVERNVDLSLFAKLIAHETKGGKMYLDTQNVLDCHYAFKRVSSNYLWLQKSINFLGLFHIVWCREMVNCGDDSTNAFTDDPDTTTRKILIPRKYYYRYNRYEYSYLTDDLDKSNTKNEPNKDLVSFNPLYVERANKCRKENKENENK